MIPVDSWNWIGDIIGRRALLTPDKEAIHDNVTKKSYTFKDLNDSSNQLARVLRTLGVKKGDRIAMLSKNRIECIELFLACGKIGAILAPLNVRLSERELTLLMEKITPKLLAYDPHLSSIVQELKKHVFLDHYLVMDEKELDNDPSMFQLMKQQESDSPPRPQLSFEDPCLILFTGGTTGLPKGAVLSHRMIFWNSINTILSWGLRPDDIQPLLFPLFHTGGWNVLLIPFLHLGAKTILMGDFDPDETIRVIEQHECTIVIGVPTMFQMMVQSPLFRDASFESVRVFISGGAPCPIAIMEQYWNKGKHFKMGYGLTEVGPNNFYLPEAEIRRKPSSVGFPVLHCDVRIVDDKGNDIPQGEVGELLLRGPCTFSGYWNDPKATEQTIDPDGWVHTGDLAKQDEDGFFYIVDRKKDMYISGGENIYPVEIEEVLYQHPAVLEAAVVGVPDEKWGEVGFAFVVLKPRHSVGTEDLKRYLEQNLARYKIPKYFEIRSELPKSGAGKILRRTLREEALKRFQ